MDPEAAIQVFENWSRTHVTIHDLGNSLNFNLSAHRFQHHHPFCTFVKSSGFDRKCIKFEIDQLREEIHLYPEGRAHVCHAGLVECVYPIMEKGSLKWVFFAGPKIPVRGLSLDKTMPLSTIADSISNRVKEKDYLLDQFELDSIMEGLRQLASRIQVWHQNYLKGHENITLKKSRKETLLHYLQLNFKKEIGLSHIALLFNISESRAAHITKEEFGDTFIALLQNIRLKSACTLLQNSELKIENIATECGFQDVSYFYKVFKAKFKMSPGKYKKQSN